MAAAAAVVVPQPLLTQTRWSKPWRAGGCSRWRCYQYAACHPFRGASFHTSCVHTSAMVGCAFSTVALRPMALRLQVDSPRPPLSSPPSFLLPRPLSIIIILLLVPPPSFPRIPSPHPPPLRPRRFFTDGVFSRLTGLPLARRLRYLLVNVWRNLDANVPIQCGIKASACWLLAVAATAAFDWMQTAGCRPFRSLDSGMKLPFHAGRSHLRCCTPPRPARHPRSRQTGPGSRRLLPGLSRRALARTTCSRSTTSCALPFRPKSIYAEASECIVTTMRCALSSLGWSSHFRVQ